MDPRREFITHRDAVRRIVDGAVNLDELTVYEAELTSLAKLARSGREALERLYIAAGRAKERAS